MSLTSLSLSLLILSSFSTLSLADDQVCNGAAALCSRPYSNITFLGTHNSPFYGNPPLPTENQRVSPTEQLNAGIRFLTAQTHNNPSGDLSVCHTSCLLEDGGTLVSYLSSIKAFLDGNANEVITLLLTNGDDLPITTFATAFTSSGLDTYAYTPSSSPLPITAWPRLSSLISTNKRAIIFLDYGAAESTTPYILNEFTHFFETPFSLTDASFPPSTCNLDRPPNSSPDGKMYIINHVLDVEVFDTGVLIPDYVHAGRTNAAEGVGSIGAHVEMCSGVYGRRANVVLVDFFDVGEGLEKVRELNGL
ncbi:PLC-like phosphodiesterase [Aulographum hederae CBS 113979]|uniref:PLC-like phosphodiesterase n=1 Tax=Aulographum hederae CBS 113979 TaxID=1176131 RepID=A0A6G1GYW0_9PEZI|nr:PLC-like phosphodiesterase [Aulographum hederae CBS 113979]